MINTDSAESLHQMPGKGTDKISSSGTILSSMALAAGAAALLFYQIISMMPISEKIQSKPPTALVETVEKPIDPKPVAVKQAEPRKPVVSQATLAAKKAELEKLKAAITPSRIRQSAITQKAIENLSRVMDTIDQGKTSEATIKSAESENIAADRTLKSLENKKELLEKEISEIASAPKPPRQALSGFSPVAKPAKGEEYHFEVIGNHVAFIDLEKPLELVKKDFQVRVRLSGSPRGIRSEVGPVGDFGLAYEIGPAMDPASGMTGFGMKGWEVIAASESRGETIAQAVEPLSNFQRVIKRLSPGQATITMWVYPSGFETFRKLRDLLHAQGYMVAARPLPEGVPVRGSPSGSLSAGQ